MSEVLQNVGAKISNRLEEISTLFKNPKITLIVRSPDLKDGDLIMTDDDLDEAIKAIENLKTRDAVNS